MIFHDSCLGIPCLTLKYVMYQCTGYLTSVEYSVVARKRYDYIMKIYYHSFYIYLQSRSSYILIFYFLFHISHIENTIHWFGSSSMSPITDCYDRTEILLRVVFNSHIASSIMIVIQYSLQEFQDTVKNNVTKIAKCFVSLQIHVDFFIIELNRQSLYYL